MGRFVNRPYRSGEGERPTTPKPIPPDAQISQHSMQGPRPETLKPTFGPSVPVASKPASPEQKS